MGIWAGSHGIFPSQAVCVCVCARAHARVCVCVAFTTLPSLFITLESVLKPLKMSSLAKEKLWTCL